MTDNKFTEANDQARLMSMVLTGIVVYVGRESSYSDWQAIPEYEVKKTYKDSRLGWITRGNIDMKYVRKGYKDGQQIYLP